ncbi:adenine phosphoribosyltransferase [Corynebacterium uberis]|uniref:adenine phosphoribosyltransferase n=1 Tax=Corynebacterium TaxID=1716 RepID=UPI001D0B8871|nr:MULTISPECIES: adenine phosphoribosyltransferase [Corynebacterium]UDL74198.1 adenine phosphoribosyltransferase [Corynebacterium uberis]UDL74919.1 adenine phosphoribosyltransferase [Corynebacterium uberis]UDL77133.1 adenine phosphoribosyltransferase [Corynebacterium uberis]UDL79416.1 adenine phosphoribosyltransferase [Corynebacterium uberis]UDL81548.1 adenine phosphoribosyltransferase [Corynebacterium uberis]
MSFTDPRPLSESHFPQARAALNEHMRYVEDFPAPGVLFQDMTPVLAQPDAFAAIIDALADAAASLNADLIGGLDARGFLLGSAVAYKMGLGIVAIRKKGKLPPPVLTQEYSLEYGTAALEIPAEAMELEGRNVVLVDDVLATGGTLVAAAELLRKAGATVCGNVVVLEVDGLGGRQRVGDTPVIVINKD